MNFGRQRKTATDDENVLKQNCLASSILAMYSNYLARNMWKSRHTQQQTTEKRRDFSPLVNNSYVLHCIYLCMCVCVRIGNCLNNLKTYVSILFLLLALRKSIFIPNSTSSHVNSIRSPAPHVQSDILISFFFSLSLSLALSSFHLFSACLHHKCSLFRNRRM